MNEAPHYSFRKAESSDRAEIWDILQQAILRRKNDGSLQWQDGYPNENTVQQDIEKGNGYVITDDDNIAAYAALIFNDEPAYEKLKGNWLSNGDFIVIHRIAVSENYTGRGLAKMILECTEDLAVKNNIFSVKADTNFDNIAMLKTFERSGYTYCGEVEFRGASRKAFEKKLKNNPAN
jgi:GNAT superfamily N-acetyltransferase